jgi:hypothetical protein
MGVFKNIGIGVDQTINCVVKLSDGWGTPDEMLSARAWRLREKHPELQLWIDRLFWWDANHCQECYEIERTRKQLVPEYQAIDT